MGLEIIWIFVVLAIILYRLDLIMDALDIPRLTLDRNFQPIIKRKSERKIMKQPR